MSEAQYILDNDSITVDDDLTNMFRSLHNKPYGSIPVDESKSSNLSNDRSRQQQLSECMSAQTLISIDTYYEQKYKTKILQVEFSSLLTQIMGLLEIDRIISDDNASHSIGPDLSDMIAELKSLIGTNCYDFSILEKAVKLYEYNNDDKIYSDPAAWKRHELNLAVCMRIKYMAQNNKV